MKIGEAHSDCLTRVQGYLALGMNVVVCNTFTRESELAPYIDYCKKNKIQFVSLIVENRHENQSIHGVPPNVMTKMRDRFSFNLDGLIMSDGVMRRANRANNAANPLRADPFGVEI